MIKAKDLLIGMIKIFCVLMNLIILINMSLSCSRVAKVKSYNMFYAHKVAWSLSHSENAR